MVGMKRLWDRLSLLVLLVVVSGCWSVEVELADLGPHSTASTLGTEEGTESATQPDSEEAPTETQMDTSPCDWQVEQLGSISAMVGFDQDALYIGGLKLDGSLLLSYYDGESWTDIASQLGLIWAGLVVNAIHGSSRTNVIAVGGVSDLLSGIIRWTGAAWQPENVTAPPLLAVWSHGPEDTYASARGVLIHNDGSGWSVQEPLFFLSRYLVDLWGLDPSDMWGVGQNAVSGSGVIVHFDGIAWSQVGLSSRFSLPALTGIWGAAPDDVYVVGGEATVLRFDGQVWAKESLPTASQDVHLSAVWGRGAQEVYAGGVDGQGRGILFVRSSGVWQLYDNGVPGIPKRLWATPTGPLLVASEQGLLSCGRLQ
jgi:hypothetical protein